jgi:hypothetical protein
MVKENTEMSIPNLQTIKYFSSKLLVLVFIVFASGCAGHMDKARESITPFGPDTYTLTYAGKHAAPTRTIVLKASNEYCTGMNKVFLPKSENQRGNSVELVFRCLNPDDPELKRTNWETRPDTIIEDRRSK